MIILLKAFKPVQLKRLHFQCQCPEWLHSLESWICPSSAAHGSCFPHQTCIIHKFRYQKKLNWMTSSNVIFNIKCHSANRFTLVLCLPYLTNIANVLESLKFFLVHAFPAVERKILVTCINDLWQCSVVWT